MGPSPTDNAGVPSPDTGDATKDAPEVAKRRPYWRTRHFHLVLAQVALGVWVHWNRGPGHLGELEGRRFEGRLQADPYPILWSRDEAGRTISYILAGPGRIGARHLVGHLDGLAIAILGRYYERDGMRMIVLEELDARPRPTDAPEIPENVEIGPAVLEGDVFDAINWITGVVSETGPEMPRLGASGVPAVLTRAREGLPPEALLLVGPEEQPLPEEIWKRSGRLEHRRREFVGRLVECGDLKILRLDPAEVDALFLEESCGCY